MAGTNVTSWVVVESCEHFHFVAPLQQRPGKRQPLKLDLGWKSWVIMRMRMVLRSP
jgi:hypothetical protein